MVKKITRQDLKRLSAEADQYKYRNELLRQYVYLGLVMSVVLAPVEYYAGMSVVGVTLNLFTLVMGALLYSTRKSVGYQPNSRVFMGATTLLFLIGFLYQTPGVDNKYFLLLYPIAAFSIRGVWEGVVWSVALAGAFLTFFTLFPQRYELFSFLFFLVAFFMVGYVVYHYRYYEILNFRHIHETQREKDRLISEKEREARKFENISVTDFLTGLYNRHKLDEVLEAECQRSRRFGHPFSVILMDVDYFKKVNDTYGHQAGDRVLEELAGIIKENIRETDVAGRWGGEEFMIICPETGIEGAADLAEFLRRKVEKHPFPKVGSKTASFGVGECRNGDEAAQTVARADEALYAAKGAGRNRVERFF